MSMTPEEAIKILEAKSKCMKREVSGTDLDCNFRNCDECDLCYKQGTTGDQMEALRVAISALQAQDVPYTNVGDMVSMQKVIDLWNKYHPTIAVDAIAYDKALKSLPSAQPETAKRIVGKSMGGMTMWYQCDMCNEPVDAQDNFCRGCGRRLTDG